MAAKAKGKGVLTKAKSFAHKLASLDLQQKNLYEFLLVTTPSSFTSPLSIISAAANTAADILATQLFAQSITFNPLSKPIFEALNAMKYLKDIDWPANITVEFLETENGE